MQPAVVSSSNIPTDLSGIKATEYQRSYSWKLPMVNKVKQKEFIKSEYQREFTWRDNNNNNTNLISSTSTTPIPPSPIPPSPIPPSPIPPPISSSSSINNISNDLSKLRLTSKSTPSLLNDIALLPDNSHIDIKHNADRLSKKIRSYSMYSLHDQLKTSETAQDLSDPLESEYKRNFVNWNEYGTASREDAYLNNKESIDLTSNRTNHGRRRGSWSAPSLPATLKWLENVDVSNKSSLRDPNKQQSSISNNVAANGYDGYDNDDNIVTSRSSRYHSKDHIPSASIIAAGVPNDKPYHNGGVHEIFSDDTRYYNDLNYSYYDNNNSNRKIHEKNRVFDEYYVENNKKYNRHDSSSLPYDDNRKDYRENNNNGYYGDVVDHHHNINNRKDYIDDDRKYREKSQRDVVDPPRPSPHSNNNKYPSDEYFEVNGREKDQYKHNITNNSIDLQRNIGHSRDTSYTSSNRSSIYEDHHLIQLQQQHRNQPSPPSHLDAFRHRNSFSSNSSISTPSTPVSPNYYEASDLKWKKNPSPSPVTEPQIYKDQLYTNVLASNKANVTDDGYYYDDVANKISKHQQPYVSSKGYISNNGVVGGGDPYNAYNNNSSRHSASSTPRSYSSLYSTPTPRSTSPTRDSYNNKKYSHHRMISSPTMSPTYSSRPPSRATSVSSHATSIEEESAILTDILKEADNATLKSLTDQMTSVFSRRDYSSSGGTKNTKLPAGSTNSKRLPTSNNNINGRATPSSNNINGRATPSSRNPKSNIMVSSNNKSSYNKSNSAPSTPGFNASKSKGHKKPSSASSISSITSYRGDIRSGASTPSTGTNFSAAREALARARLQVEQMLEIVDNGGTIDF
ncbi:10084_t:CDS:2 [Entrophospora sp. SA101]|nr:10084_t:CDS:2 [Entrophospora sp. SA101]